MEQPCYKCGQTVEQGIPFCPHCSAPQIRVVIAAPSTSGAAAAHSPLASQSGVSFPASSSVAMPPVPTRWPGVLRSCILAAVIAVLLGFLTQLLIVALLAAGFLAVVFHRQRRPGILLTALEGAKVGSLAGILCCGILSLLVGFAATVPDVRAKMQDQYIAGAQRAAAWLPPNPDIQARIDLLKTPQGFREALIEAGIAFFVFSVVLAGVGGALGGVILGRRNKP
jgi:hypothetical protein